MKITNTLAVVSPNDLHNGLSSTEIAERQRVVSAIRDVSQGNMFGANRELTFSLDRATHRVVIQVIDRNTGDTVMQLPLEYILRLSQSMQHRTPIELSS